MSCDTKLWRDLCFRPFYRLGAKVRETYCLLIGWFVSRGVNAVFWLVGLCHVVWVLYTDWRVSFSATWYLELCLSLFWTLWFNKLCMPCGVLRTERLTSRVISLIMWHRDTCHVTHHVTVWYLTQWKLQPLCVRWIMKERSSLKTYCTLTLMLVNLFSNCSLSVFSNRTQGRYIVSVLSTSPSHTMCWTWHQLYWTLKVTS